MWIDFSAPGVAVANANAVSGSVVVMKPDTGDILAMANEPTFDPNKYGDAGPDSRRNRAIQDVYEPGSTFKIVTASAGLLAGLLAGWLAMMASALALASL